MTRDKFIRKWLANPQKQYNEQCRDEMLEDLDLVIKAAIICKSEEKQTAVEWLFHTLWDEPKDKLTWYAILKEAKELHKEEIMEAHFAPKYGCFNEQYYNETFGGNNEQQ